MVFYQSTAENSPVRYKAVVWIRDFNKLEQSRRKHTRRKSNRLGGRATAQKNEGCYSPSVCSVLVAQLCLTLWDPMDCCPPGSSIHWLSQARILEWVAINSSREFSQPRNQTNVSCTVVRFLTVWATWKAKPKRNKLTYVIEPMEDWGFGDTKGPKCFTQYANKFGKLSSGHRTGKGQFSFQSQRRAKPKNVQTTIQLHSFQMQAILRILQARLQQ